MYTIVPQAASPKGCKVAKTLNRADRNEIEQLISGYESVFANNPKGPNQCKGTEHVIISKDGRAVKDKVRRINAKDLKQINSQIDEMLKNGIIRKSKSPYNSNIHLVGKKDGSKRFCIDFRSLNKNTTRDNYPMPRVDDMIDECRGCSYFTQLDLASAYWGIAVREEDREKLAFSVPRGKYECCRMPYGLLNAQSTFQRTMDELIKKLHERGFTGVNAYVDNIFIFSRSWAENVATTKAVFEILKEYNLSLRKDKCEFGFKTIDFLGYTIDANGVRASSENVQKVQEFPVPASRKEVQRFLGIANYNRRFVKDFAKIAAPLSALTSPKTPFVFGEKEEAAFNAIKKCIYEAPLLTLPDYEKTFHIRTDASEIAVGAMVFQLQGDEEYPIAYHSKTLQGSEKNWGATDRELFAIISANRKWTHFCTGKVVFHTDHEPLKHIRNLKDPRGKITRWLLELEGRDYTVQYIKGKLNTTADYLSRIATVDKGEDEKFDEDLHVYALFIDNSAEVLSIDRIAEEQKKDSVLKKTIEEIKEHGKVITGPLRRYDCKLSEEGVLLKGQRVVVPTTMTAKVIQEYHCQHHYGCENTLLLLKTRFYWNNMATEVEKFVQGCRTYAQCKHAAVPKAKMTTDKDAPAIMERIAIDIATMPRTKRDNKYILAIVDCCSGFIAAAVMANQKAESIERALWKQWLAYFSLPEELMSDQGKNVDGNVVRELCRRLGIKKLRSSPYHPEGNGIAERSISSLKTIIRTIAHARQMNPAEKWDLIIDEAVLAKNSMGNKSTKTDAFKSMFGKSARLPIDNMVNLRFTGEEIDRKVLSENIRLNRMESQEASKRMYDKNSKVTELNVGDEVLIKRNFGEYPKVNVKWKEGPYVIAEKLSPCSYKIRNNRGQTSVRHHNQIKPAGTKCEAISVPHPLMETNDRNQYGFLYPNINRAAEPLNTEPIPNTPTIIHRHNSLQPTAEEVSTTVLPTNVIPVNEIDLSGFRRNVFQETIPPPIPAPSPPMPAPTTAGRTSSRSRTSVIGNRLCDTIDSKPLACER